MDIDGIRNVPVMPQSTPVKAPAPATTSSAPDVAVQEPAVDTRTATTNLNPAPIPESDVSRARNRREEEATTKMLQSAIESANEQLASSDRKLQASVHDRTNRITVQVICTQSNEVIKEIPPEKTLDMLAKMLEMAGLLYDEAK